MKILESIMNNERYKTPECVGDIALKEKVELFIKTFNKLDNVNNERVKYYINKLIKDDWEAWWYHYSKAYIKTVLWFIRRLKKDIIPQEEFNLLKMFYQRLPYSTQHFGMYGMDNLQRDKELAIYFQSHGVNIK